MEVLFADEMRALDQGMIKDNMIPGIVLMENAAEGLFDACLEYGSESSRFLIFCGLGNNGGDGFALARKMMTEGYQTSVFLMGPVSALKGDAQLNAAYFIKSGFLREVNTTFDVDQALLGITESDIIVDAIFGIGLSRDIEGLVRDTIDLINNCPAKVISADIPSGINADTGQIMGSAVHADLTLTFQHPKPGHFIYPGRDLKGHLRVKKIGIDRDIHLNKPIKINAYPRGSEELSMQQRDHNTHKGTYGSLALICASQTMTGAGIMAANAALKGGVGLLNMCVPACVAPVFQSAVPQAITLSLPSDDESFDDRAVPALDDFIGVMDAVVVGPGITTGDDVALLVRKLISSYDLPKVFDADALSIIAKNPKILENITGDAVFTPHPKEFMRLTGIPVNEILKDPIHHVADYARMNNVILLLKGATTYIASPYGDVAMVLTGTPGMSKGGSGDVLAGLIGALMAQQFSAYDAALMGAYIAGIAGEMAAADIGEYSMTPMDTVEQIARAIALM